MEKHNVFTRVNKVMLATVIAITTLGMGGTAAFAAPADPGGTGAGLGSVSDGVESWVATYGVPAIISLLLIGVGVGLLIRWGKRAKNMV